MNELPDARLLEQFASDNSEEAFSALVQRHIALVHSVALRHTANPQQAQDITQAVFVILARKAKALGRNTVLPGWLYHTARLTAANFKRTEMRRGRREQEAFMQSEIEEHANDPLWRELSPQLDEAMACLGTSERDALVLRYFQNKTMAEVGGCLGLAENTAQKRVSRALEKLRRFFLKRGVASTTTAIAAMLSANSVQAVPLGLAATITTTAINSSAVAASTLTLIKGALEVMAWTKAKVVIGASVVVVLAVQHHQNAAQARQIAAARQQLNGQAEALAAQESRAQELEQQTAGILETRISQQKDLERLLARRKAAGQGGQSLGGARPTSTLLAATLSDPDAREALRQQLLAGNRYRLSPLIEGLKLDQQKAEKLLGIEANEDVKNLETAVAFTEGTLTAEAAMRTEADTERDANNQIRLLLGNEGFAGYQEYQKEFPARTLVDQFNKQLGPFPITAFQQAALARAIEAEPPEVACGLAGDFTVRELVSPDGLDGRFAAQTESNQRILQAAAGFLSPEQVESLRLMQVSNMSAQKQTVLRMLRKL